MKTFIPDAKNSSDIAIVAAAFVNENYTYYKFFSVLREVVSSESIFSNYIRELTILLHSHTTYICVCLYIYTVFSVFPSLNSVFLYLPHILSTYDPEKYSLKQQG